jgi:hypothetical protein
MGARLLRCTNKKKGMFRAQNRVRIRHFSSREGRPPAGDELAMTILS